MIERANDEISELGAPAVEFVEKYLKLPHEERESYPGVLDPASVTHNIEVYYQNPEVLLYPLMQKAFLAELFDSYYEHCVARGKRYLFGAYMQEWVETKRAGITPQPVEESFAPEVLNRMSLNDAKKFAKEEYSKTERSRPQHNVSYAANQEERTRWRHLCIDVNKAVNEEGSS